MRGTIDTSAALSFFNREVNPLDAKFYEVLAMAMRYFFTAMGVLIVWRSFSWLMKDRRLKHRRLHQLPDAGTIGNFTEMQGGRHLPEGAIIPVPHEGVLGAVRTCDVVVPVDDVATMHIDFTFQDGKGLFIRPRRGCEAVVDGVPIVNRRDSQSYPMQHGSVLEVGQSVLRLGVFAGLNVPEVAFTAPDAPDVPPEEMPPQTYPQDIPLQPWQQPMNPPQPWYPPAPPHGQPFVNGANPPWNEGGDGDAR